MCIVEIFPEGVEKNTEFFFSAIEQGLKSNSCGGGFAHKRKGEHKIFIHKGFKVSDIHNGNLRKAIEERDIKLEDEFVFHGRISTSGDTTSLMLHPFACSEDPEIINTIKGYVTVPVISHNGVFRSLGNKEGLKTSGISKSDTYEFAQYVMSDPAIQMLAKKDPVQLVSILDKIDFSWSKVSIIWPDDTPTSTLEPSNYTWHKENGALFSNNGYKTYTRNVGGVEDTEWRNRFQNRNADWIKNQKNNRLAYGYAESEDLFLQSQSRNGTDVTSKTDIYSGNINGIPIVYSNSRIIPNLLNMEMLVGKVIGLKTTGIDFGSSFLITALDHSSYTAWIAHKNKTAIQFPVSYDWLYSQCEFSGNEASNDTIISYKRILDHFKRSAPTKTKLKKIKILLNNSLQSPDKGIRRRLYSWKREITSTSLFSEPSIIEFGKNAGNYKGKQITLETDAILLYFLERAHLAGLDMYSFSDTMIEDLLFTDIISDYRKVNALETLTLNNSYCPIDKERVLN